MLDQRSLPRRSEAGRPDKLQVQRAFSAAARSYDHLADLQRRVADRLVEELASAAVDGCCLLDVGTGTGYCAARLAGMFPGARLIALDLAESMLQQVRRSVGARTSLCLVSGDAEALPIADRAVDLVVSNLALQWCPEPAAAIREFARVLKPDGQLFFTTFGTATLSELREAWAQADHYSHVNTFDPAAALNAMMVECGLESLFLETKLRVIRYADVAALMRELKGLGAHNVTSDRPRGLVGKGVLARMMGAYRERYFTADGGIEASFEVIYGAARRRVR